MWQKIKNIYHLIVAFLANVWYAFPSRKLIVVGVTGTDGKTTTVSLIYHILKEAGYPVSMITSVGVLILGREYNMGFHVTTPSPFALQRFLKKAAGYLVLEVTSHSLDQNRVWGTKFDIGVLTNITHEHLDYHKTYEEYVRAKAKLLEMSKIAIVNRDDRSYRYINSKFKIPVKYEARPWRQSSKLQSKIKKFIAYGMSKGADITPYKFPFESNLVGEFNKYNILAAIAVCQELGVLSGPIRRAIATFRAPAGRQELVHEGEFKVVIDFAHTPNSFENVLSTLRPEVRGRIIHVFGSAGERDRLKRPIMGRVSSKYSDIIVLTAEDPRSESVDRIIEQIESGIQSSEFRVQNLRKNEKRSLLVTLGARMGNGKYLFKIPDREQAIEFAIRIAKIGDLVLLTGKSHEKSMNLGRGEEAWDEFGVAREAIEIKSRGPVRGFPPVSARSK